MQNGNIQVLKDGTGEKTTDKEGRLTFIRAYIKPK